MTGPGAVCPSCGVAVVPGYVRCPKCQAPLGGARKPVAEGGTAVTGGRFPLAPLAVAVVVAGVIIAVFGVNRHAGAPPPASPAAAAPAPAPASPATSAPAPAPAAVPAAPPDDTAARPDPDVLANRLQHALQHEELWSTVEVVGDHVDVRSSACNDPAMKPMLAGAAKGFRAAGLTRLRCLEQSGAVVFARDL